MTTADEKLCHDIAKAEGWKEHRAWGRDLSDKRQGNLWESPDPQAPLENKPPAYLTDPAVLLRMEKNLIDYYKQCAFSKTEDGKIFIMLGDITQEMFELTKHSDHEHAVAEAYLAMPKETK